jgi:hypothetical protein
VLSLLKNRLQDLSLKGLEGCTALRELNLGGNELKRIDLADAATKIAKAANGSTKEFARLGLHFAANATAAEKLETVLRFIEERFGGRAQADIGTYAGKIGQVAKAWDELKEAIGRRRSMRFLAPYRPVEREKIQKMLEAARQCSFWGNVRALRGTVIGSFRPDCSHRRARPCPCEPEEPSSGGPERDLQGQAVERELSCAAGPGEEPENTALHGTLHRQVPPALRCRRACPESPHPGHCRRKIRFQR